jgi:hypothetical protein
MPPPITTGIQFQFDETEIVNHIAKHRNRELTTIHNDPESADTRSPKIITSHGNGNRSSQIIVTATFRFPAVPIGFPGTIQYRQEAY